MSISRIGKLPIELKEVTATIDTKTDTVILKKGSIEKKYKLDNGVTAIVEDGKLRVVKKEGTNDADVKKFLGTHRSRLNNDVKGLNDGYEIVLEANGVGYKSNISGNFLILSLGYSHDIAYVIPEGIKIKTEKPNLIVISGVDKQKVGQIASEIIDFRPPEPYKGKGVKKKGAWILRKEGKKK